MSADELLKTRIKELRTSEKQGKCILYVMSRDQRVQDNHALLAAQKHALALNLPLTVVFCLYEKSGVRSREHYVFMLDGLREVESSLNELNIPFMMLVGEPRERLEGLFHHVQPHAVYFDFSPLRGPRRLQAYMAKKCDISMYVVDTHNVVPSWVASDKREVGAYTMRPKLHKKLSLYLREPEAVQVHPITWTGKVMSMEELLPIISEAIDKIPASSIAIDYVAGSVAALNHLEEFMNNKLDIYAESRNDPSLDGQSDLSPYLHFGHISSLRVALLLQELANTKGSDLHLLEGPKMPKSENTDNVVQHGIDVLIEEMIVRKELADNFCLYCDDYDSINAAANWARNSLDKHRNDPREYVYSLLDLEQAKTHDAAWNASQLQLTTSGKMHGYMRMYWAKKVLEWTESPEQAISFLIQLNDHYSVDGGDPNGYAGILWSVAGIHDRPWQERDIFGMVRYMNYGGLKRKFDIDTYEKKYN